ncbi:MAG TPA: glycosyl hydrolase [Planctomycetota bacterium]|jgi:hypothetical protein
MGELWHKKGLIYFWCLNDKCDLRSAEKQIDAFAAGNVAAVCLHPRAGLLLPYGGDDWFSFIRHVVDCCARRNLDVWLYDEDPFPSGGAGGRITAENPEYAARAIEQFHASAPDTDGLFCFPAGKLLWCAVVDAHDETIADLTGNVGMVRRKWTVLDPWDSRWYYPATPLYNCPRAWTGSPEFAVRVPALRRGERVVSFVARPCETGGDWGGVPDTLNPEVTRLFIKLTHERYAAELKPHFGKTIKAIFTDEPKYFGQRPWTPDLFADFARQNGYDLRPRLVNLFSADDTARSLQTRLDYRHWCGQRFANAWLKPVAEWCHQHELHLVGHISPEDDPVQQSASLTNLFPLFQFFDIPGLDLIIPAVGDHAHPLLNIGVIAARSAADQQGKPGVMSEDLGCSGLEMTAQHAERILLWHALMGVTTPVIHGAFSSSEGNRLIEAPPDFGPQSARWKGMCELSAGLEEVQEVVRGSQQVAPVACLWPIRSFNAQNVNWQPEPGGMRGNLTDLLTACLDNQVGVHLLDEADLWHAQIFGPSLRVGRAEYTHVLIPSTLLLHQRTLQKLDAAQKSGIAVIRVGDAFRWIHTDSAVVENTDQCSPPKPIEEATAELPKLLELRGEGADVRCTAWSRDGKTTRLLMNLRQEPTTLSVNGELVQLLPGKVVILRA